MHPRSAESYEAADRRRATVLRWVARALFVGAPLAFGIDVFFLGFNLRRLGAPAFLALACLHLGWFLMRRSRNEEAVLGYACITPDMEVEERALAEWIAVAGAIFFLGTLALVPWQGEL
jgi:hypothetical protein